MSETATTFGLDTTRVVFGAGASEETGEHLRSSASRAHSSSATPS